MTQGRSKKPRRRDGYDEARRLVIRGLEGLLSGQELKVRLGETIVIGRSRECDLHPRIAEGADASAARRMSREHLRVSFCHPQHVEVEDLSTNGTFLHGKRIDRVVLKTLAQEPAVFDFLAGTLLIEEESL